MTENTEPEYIPPPEEQTEPEPEPPKKKITRDELELMASSLLRLIHRKASSHRFKPAADDARRLQYVRTTLEGLKVYGQILERQEITEIAIRVENLEKQRERCRE